MWPTSSPNHTLTLPDSLRYRGQIELLCSHAWHQRGHLFFDTQEALTICWAHCYDLSLRNHSDELWMRTGCNEQGLRPYCNPSSMNTDRALYELSAGDSLSQGAERLGSPDISCTDLFRDNSIMRDSDSWNRDPISYAPSCFYDF